MSNLGSIPVLVFLALPLVGLIVALAFLSGAAQVLTTVASVLLFTIGALFTPTAGSV